MLVISSDLHLTDGTSGETIQTDAFRIFKYRLRDMAYAASRRLEHDGDHRQTKTYKPINDIYLVLLGDILDCIRSTQWLRGSVRPWDDPKSTATKIQKITEEILRNNDESLEMLRNFKKCGVYIPTPEEKAQAEATGAPPNREGSHCVKVHIFYVCGNHDWFYHAPGPDYDALRANIVDALGLENPPDQPFPHHTDELPALRRISRAHNVFARHGDVFDRNNFERPSTGFSLKDYKPSMRDQSSLGDAVVIELVDKFADAVRQRFETVETQLAGGAKERFREASRPVADGLKDIDNVRPMELIPAWVQGLLNHCDPLVAKEVRETWNQVVEEFLKVPFVKDHHCRAIKWGLRATEGVSFGALGRVVPWGKSVLMSLGTLVPPLQKALCHMGMSDDFYQCALADPAYDDPEVYYIVYGHTHRHEIVPLRISTREKHKFAYLNAGTWRAVFDRTKEHPSDNDFFGYHVMTYLSFFTEEERSDHEFESWCGSLESPMLREA